MTYQSLFGLLLAIGMVFGGLFAAPAVAQNGPLHIEITEGVIEPLPFAVPDFVPENAAVGVYTKKH